MNLETLHERDLAETVACDADPPHGCGAAIGETCRNGRTGEPLVHQAAHDYRLAKAGVVRTAAAAPTPDETDPGPAAPAAVVEVVNCNFCRGEIMWLTTGTGKRMPVDAAPDPLRGNVMRQGAAAAVLGLNQAAGARDRGVQLCTHHVVTCPHADQWRSGTPKAARR